MVDPVTPTSPAAALPSVLEVRHLTKRYPLRRGLFGARDTFAAVDGVSFAINEARTLGLVGESGCGKSTLARMILRLITPTSGDILFRGDDILSLRGRALKPFRRRVQIIFQDPVGSLNPRLKVGTIVGEPLIVHGLANAKTVRDRVADLLEQCGLWADAAARYPHEFSGGQRQRIGIARAVALRPELIICDEPTSALDVSVQAQILNLLKDLQQEHKLSYLFISHDLAVVRYMADEVAVMQRGKIVEHGPVDAIVNDPQHEYTQQLLAAVPELAAV